MKILGIESSCDETAASVVEDGRNVLSNIVASQAEVHALYGGVVPEIASRAHCEALTGVVKEALEKAECTLNDIDAIAVTYAPGLIGALLTGLSFAKGLSFSCGKPLVPVHHIRGHVAANYIAHTDLKPPFIALVVSGGHTSLLKVDDYTCYTSIGQTRDDAAGEAFDKAARMLGLPYPGGAAMDRLASLGNKNAMKFTISHVDNCPYDFSFSGLKTAVINQVHTMQQKGIELTEEFKADLAASFTETLVKSICLRVDALYSQVGKLPLVLAGGVAANSH
ncbi:MAG: tRNA (adenosine(37)-N6)-threonylcarbamoyltransferase complex transferase subunit TsaD, partial [Clostridia bacterium]|nr:tRNA (adenosine(37)-N6)-threonylcarbamoyltransferase complex transferase subunit TsaD [Clostridia bacterium]